MIVFSPLRTRRLEVRLKELSIGDEIALCHLPEGAHEKALTEFLCRVIDTASTPSYQHLDNPRAWSVGERLLVLAHYCVHTREDRPDYAVTEVSTLSDYLDMARDLPSQPATFDALEDQWVLHPLIGAAVEALESMQAGSALRGREFWLLGSMAAQLLRAGESHPDPVVEYAEYLAWLRTRIETMQAIPSSGFEVLYTQYCAAQQQDTQFFKLWFDDLGVIVLAKEAGAVTPPARFLISACLGAIAISIAGKSQ